MTLMDILVSGREAVLNTALRVDTGHILNDRAITDAAQVSAAELGAEVKQAVNAFKASAMDARGASVDYQRLRKSDAYATYRAECTPRLRRVELAALRTRDERLAFWINLYNALVIDAVVAFGVEGSVAEGFAGVLRFFRRAAYDVGGHRFSLDDIEHGILRGNRGHPFIPGLQFGSSEPRMPHVVTPVDPRIHFALNCASRSCPPIGVYDPEDLDTQLDRATANFVAEEVHFEREVTKVRLSAIFSWYAADFGGRLGVIEFLVRHLPDDEDRRWLDEHREDIDVEHTAYDWRLNVARL